IPNARKNHRKSRHTTISLAEPSQVRHGIPVKNACGNLHEYLHNTPTRLNILDQTP
ncbi:hypothetical protein BGX23_004088, partial [Mortierella sp. AD031]